VAFFGARAKNHKKAEESKKKPRNTPSARRANPTQNGLNKSWER
jgi:hypothetical protein